MKITNLSVELLSDPDPCIDATVRLKSSGLPVCDVNAMALGRAVAAALLAHDPDFFFSFVRSVGAVPQRVRVEYSDAKIVYREAP